MAERDDRRQARLAQALRANLKRRKAGEGETPRAPSPVPSDPARDDRD